MKNSSRVNYYLSLGTNLGDRRANLVEAVEFLRGIGSDIRLSAVYETPPVGMEPGSPVFYNMAAVVVSQLEPTELLTRIKTFEAQMGRDISDSHYRPRTIDIDILMADDRVMETGALVIPHREMARRAFVLVPLNEIAPDALHPVLKKSVSRLLEELGNDSQSPDRFPAISFPL